MPNTIELAKIYVPITDDIYKKESLTVDLDTADALIKQGYNANEIVIPKLDMSGLGEYSRNEGYVNGDVSITWETVKAEFDRGRGFNVDELDNTETGGVAFGKLAGNFIREKVVPELDAYRFASYASTEGISSTAEDITTGKQAIAAIRLGAQQMDEDEVPAEGRILYITSPLKGLIDDMDTTASKKLLEEFKKIVKVPQKRFYTLIKQYKGSEDSDTDRKIGGYEKAANGKNINFMIIHPSAVIQANKLVQPKIIAPSVNMKGDMWFYGYRLVSIARVWENKRAGVYCSHATS